MTLSLYISKSLAIQLHPLVWFLYPQQHLSGTWTSYQWLFVTVNYNRPTAVQKNWSDDDVVRQMKNLEKEVEAIKPKPKTKPSYKRG
jgi:hypothetical protein